VFARVAIVNRGEAAMRLLNAVRELNAERELAARLDGGGRSAPLTTVALTTVALYTEAERSARFVREADVAYDLGPAADRPYIDLAVLERALVETRADAAWVGWGFVAEDPAFAELCDRLGVTFVGPSAEAMRKLGDKIGAKLLAERVGVPVAPWSRGPVEDVEDALRHAAGIGYPLMLKATAGGGGRGIRVVTTDAELVDAFARTSEEAARAFGSGVVFLERLVTGARHVEVQVIADGQGTAWALGVRDCSVQRRNQKVIEESASPVLRPDDVRRLKASAEALALEVGYRGAGTVEFLYHPGDGTLAFLEVNTRLQVEHPITELTTGFDLVKAQLHVAAGGRLTGQPPAEQGHAVEARLNAEDPDRDFAPAPGRVALLGLPAGPGVRVDTGLGEGDVIPADFDSMIAKVIAYGRDRSEALARLRRALADTHVVIEGGATNKSFLLDLLDQPEVVDGSADTGWIDRVRTTGRLVAQAHAGVALVVAGIEAYEEQERAERQHFLATAHGGRPQARHEVGRAIDLKLRGDAHRITVAQVGPDRFRVTLGAALDGRHVDAEVERLDDYSSRLAVGGRTFRVVSATHGPVHSVEVDGVTHRVTRDEGGVLRSPAPALVVAVPVEVGAEVEAGARLLVLESMKMETVIASPFAARVREIAVTTGSQVEAGAPLLRLEPVQDDGAAAGGRAEAQQAGAAASVAADLPEQPPASPAARAGRVLEDLRALVLGFDLPPGDEARALGELRAVRGQLAAAAGTALPSELAVLRAFADIAELSRNRPGEREDLDERVHSPREHFHSYLHSLDVEREQLPDAFRERLTRALSHYGVTDLERGPALEEAVFRVFLALQRTPSHLGVVTAILQHWLGDDAPSGPLAEEAHELLDRLVVATQARYPLVGDLARSARFRWFDQPLVDQARASVLAGVRAELDALAETPDTPDHAERIEALAAIPEQIVRFLAERLERGTPEREPMLEVLVRRHYREFELHDLRVLDAGRRPVVVADYTLDGRPTRLVSTLGQMSELQAADGALVSTITEQVDAVPAGSQVVVDLYLHWPGAPESPAGLSSGLAGALAAVPFMRRLRRIAVGVHGGGGRELQYLTFRPVGPADTRGVVEDELVRGVHPMVARRLDLWRLRSFDVRRLDAPHDVLLYHCVAPDNPADQRLVATTQVREMAVVRDSQGHVTSLPHVERAVASCLEAIRRARSAMGPRGARLDMNHVWLHIWPVLDAPLQELTALKDTLSPVTSGAGLEEVAAQGRIKAPDGTVRAAAVRFTYQPGSGVVATVTGPPTERLEPLDEYAQKVLRSRRRGTVYPYELLSRVAGPGGTFTEHDLDDMGSLVPVERPPGHNKAGVVVGVATTPTTRHPEGMTRVVLLGDPTKALGAVAEAECARVSAALDLAAAMDVPVEWYALSAGARISMDSGTENMDWVARALRRIVEFTQDGGEVNVVVAGINVGAQPYWNAEATMLMHTKGILVMTPDSAMVLTGKQSLDFSGGVSAEDNFGIGGFDRVMGPNGQAQYWAPDLGAACDVLLAHYEHSYLAPGERRPRQAPTSDPVDRDVRPYPHAVPESDFRTVGDIFSPATNPDRKKAFDIRTVMRAVADSDHPVLERWAGMADADTSVVFDAHLGGWPVCLLGFESKPVPRRGFPPSDGPDIWTAGTLFPRSSKKTARAINAASGNRPLVVLANLSGFDGSPDSMKNLQLEYGAEIGRAVVNFEGPIVFCVVSRYHGGAFVVFSKALNDNMTVLAVEGSYASVIGGAPAAAVVFAGEVDARTAADPRVRELEQLVSSSEGARRAALVAELGELRAAVRTEKLGEVAAAFDGVHSIQRAVAVGSVDAVVAAAELRPRLVEAVERGLDAGRP
jgi:acetyl/propionyl-CoA carboxylase alpha subunit/acetyl-CoA carboxylase carboxyltransferase component